jgi:hypothetical protein
MRFPLSYLSRDWNCTAVNRAELKALLVVLLAALLLADAGAQSTSTNSAPFTVVSSKHRREITDKVIASSLMCKSTRQNMTTFMDLVENFDLVGSSAMDGSISSTTFRGQRAGRSVAVKFFVNSRTNLLSSVWVDGDLVLACDADGRVEDFRAQQPPTTAPNLGNVAPSFDCTRASSRAEHLICGDQQLANLDRELAVLYNRALGKVSDRAAFRRESIEQWRSRETACAGKPCLVDWFTRRIERLRSITGD